MRLLAAAVCGLLLLSASGADAWPGSHKHKFPRPLDSPIVRPKTQEGHKAGKQGGRHPERYQRMSWGAEKNVYRMKPPQLHSWLYQVQQ